MTIPVIPITAMLYVGALMAPAVATYEPRDPSSTVLYNVIAAHLETFLASLDDDPDAKGLPDYVPGCVLITSAVEAVQDPILECLAKGHTRQDFLDALALCPLALCRRLGIPLNPTFVAFTPWTTLDGYIELLTLLAEQGLVEHVAPIQLAMRLLIPAGSKLLELPDMQDVIEDFDDSALTYR